MNIMNIESAKKLETFKKRLLLINGSLEDKLAKKYLAMYTQLLKSSERCLTDLINNQAHKIRFIGYTKVNFEDKLPQLRVLIKENEYSRRQSAKQELLCYPELDICANLLDLAKPHSASELKTVRILDGTLKPVECLTVYTDAVNSKSAVCVPSVSIVDVLSQIPEEKLGNVSAFALWLERDFPTSAFNMLLNKFAFKVMLYSGDLPDEVFTRPVVCFEHPL